MPTRRPRTRRALLLAGLIAVAAAVVGLAFRRRTLSGVQTAPAGRRGAERASPLVDSPSRSGAAGPALSRAVLAPSVGSPPPTAPPAVPAAAPLTTPPAETRTVEAPQAAVEASASVTSAEPAAATGTLPAGADLFAAATEAPETSAPAASSEGPYGPGSAYPLSDGSAPGPEFTIKGNATSKLFHTPSSPYFARMKAEAWFRTAEDAEAAGFTKWTPRPRPRAADPASGG